VFTAPGQEVVIDEAGTAYHLGDLNLLLFGCCPSNSRINSRVCGGQFINVFINWLPPLALVAFLNGNNLSGGTISIAILIYLLKFGLSLSPPGQRVRQPCGSGAWKPNKKG